LSGPNVISNVSIGIYYCFWGASTISTCIHQIPAFESAREVAEKPASLAVYFVVACGWLAS
jgi:hypothetical protein